MDEAARTWLANRGYDPVYGARPLKRVIQKELQDPLAEKLLAGEILDGAVVPVTAGDGGLVIGGPATAPARRAGALSGSALRRCGCAPRLLSRAPRSGGRL